ncbi:MAG TPA: hypothetical protein VHA52_13415, partial [Candidatus Babeliaceae bacterium]|nr:hypothetical protein [Candidatus Babeliaceae bacterium]
MDLWGVFLKNKILAMHLKTFLLLFFFMGVLVFVSHAQPLPAKKLIEYGWDYPTVSDLKSNIKQMEKAPFEGVCFSIDKNIYAAFDNTAYPDSKFQFNNLSGIPWQKFTDNFLIVRGTSLTGA